MTRKLLSLIVATFAFTSASAQDFSTFLKKHAVKIDKLDSLSAEIYNLVFDYRLIMVGEMHGTHEPATFVVGLAELFVSHGDTVQAGFEIPSRMMSGFIKEHTENSIYSSSFFADTSTDGRASVAWAAAIARLNKNPKVKLFFYDTNGMYDDTRDSVMYMNIKSEMMLHPKRKTITISGNVHNMLAPFREKSQPALYLSKDTELNLADSICTLNHLYGRGTANMNRGKGLRVYETGGDSEYSTVVDFDNYFFLYPLNYEYAYKGIFFTKTVTAAKLARDK